METSSQDRLPRQAEALENNGGCKDAGAPERVDTQQTNASLSKTWVNKMGLSEIGGASREMRV